MLTQSNPDTWFYHPRFVSSIWYFVPLLPDRDRNTCYATCCVESTLVASLLKGKKYAQDCCDGICRTSRTLWRSRWTMVLLSCHWLTLDALCDEMDDGFGAEQEQPDCKSISEGMIFVGPECYWPCTSLANFATAPSISYLYRQHVHRDRFNRLHIARRWKWRWPTDYRR